MRDICRNNVIIRNKQEEGRVYINNDYRWQPIENEKHTCQLIY